MFKENVTEEQLKKILEVQKKVKLLGFDEEANVGSYKYSYTSLAKIRVELGKILEEVGLGVSQPITIVDGKQAIRTIIFDEKGIILDSTSYLEIMNPGDPQSFGKSVTYQRRYCLVSLLFIVADKDDDVVLPEEDIQKSIEEARTLQALVTLYKRLDKNQQTKYQKVFGEKKKELTSPKEDIPTQETEKKEQSEKPKKLNKNLQEIVDATKIKGEEGQ